MQPGNSSTSPMGMPPGMGDIAGEIYRLGMALLHQGRLQSAAFQFSKALALVPDAPEAALSLGHCLHEMEDYQQALQVYDRLLTITPQSAAAWNNRGITLLALCRHAQAVESFLHALEFVPDLHDTRVALATCYQSLGKIEEALDACNSVLAAAPTHAEAHWNRSLLLLLNGDYEQGWREYEWRWKKRRFSSPQRDFPQPLWRGEPAAGKTLLVHAEQGFGDTIQFCRYLPLLAKQGIRVVFECHPPLSNLMHTLDGGIQVVPMGSPLPPFDLHVPLLSLPLRFGTTLATIPDSMPYLAPPPDRHHTWRQALTAGSGLKAGLCWAGKSYPDPLRTCPAEMLSPLATVPGVTWYSLQLDVQESPHLPLVDLTRHIRDFSDTAALISNLDLVVTIDTAMAHLAGALGKPVYLMLPFSADWRWLRNRSDSPWYPATTIVRQGQAGQWQGVVQRVIHALGQETTKRL